MQIMTVLNLLGEYGIWILLAIAFLEALNCPGMPAGVIFPAAGMYASFGRIPWLLVLGVTVLGGVLGSIVLYAIGRRCGNPILAWLAKRSSKLQKAIDKSTMTLERGGFWTLFLSRITPVVRTIMPIPAGALCVDVKKFILSGALGIACYNLACIGFGYFFGNVLF